MKKQFAAIDMAKFILALLVVVLHVNPMGKTYGELRFPITRIAVPMFFIISSYLLFGKIANTKDKGEKSRYIKQFCKRNLQLYFAWFVVLLPITVYSNTYFHNGFLLAIKELLLRFLFGSTFSASWYIMALILGTLIVWFLSRYFHNYGCLAIGVLAYGVCCLASNYRGLLVDSSLLLAFFDWYPVNIFLSFPVSVVWISIGKIMAERPWRFQEASAIWKTLSIVSAILLLYVEHFFVERHQLSYANDCYVSLLLVSPLLASIIFGINVVANEYTRKLRGISTVMYCSHLPCQRVLGFLLKKFYVDITSLSGALLLFILVVGCCMMLAVLIDVLKKYRFLKWLRYFQ